MASLHDLATLAQIVSSSRTTTSGAVVVEGRAIAADKAQSRPGINSSKPSPSPNHQQPQQRTPYQFPWKLHQLLTDAEKNNDERILSWLPGGMAFQIHNKEAFIKKYMPTYFNTQTYKSFHRSLNLWGFQSLKRGNTPHGMNMIRMLHAINYNGPTKTSKANANATKGPNKSNPVTTVGAYFHPLFLRGSPQLCKQMKRVNKPQPLPKQNGGGGGNVEAFITATTTASTGASSTAIITPTASTTSSITSADGTGSGSGTNSSINKERCKAAIAGCGGDVSATNAKNAKKSTSAPKAAVALRSSPPVDHVMQLPSKPIDSMLVTKMMIERSKRNTNSRLNVPSSVLPSAIIKGTRKLIEANKAATTSPYRYVLHQQRRDEILNQALLLQQQHHPRKIHHEHEPMAMVEAAVATRRMELLMLEQKRVELILQRQQEEDILIDAAIRQRQHEAKVKGLQIQLALNALQQQQQQKLGK